MTTTTYRPDIDGLRAIAVMSVVLFHADVTFFSGGYAGVDVFFVISGFLITRLLTKALAEESFTYSDFYLRRARRLFPALFVTLLLVLLTATVMFLPFHLQRLGGALASALFWCSNIFFWTESGYFDAEASLKPLLHTWSLGVEEQFYLVWPTFMVMLFALGKRVWLIAGIAIISLVSLAAAELWLAKDSSAAFYLAPFRVYEFGIGALLVFVYEKKPATPIALELLLLAGLGLVAYSMLAFDEHTPFPGFSALVPCLGTALIIYAGQAERVGALLRNPVSRYLGLISYSLYLVHWPVVVFYKYSVESFTRIDKLAVIVIAIGLAALMYRFVETPLRKPSSESPRRFIVGCVGSALALTMLSAGAWFTQGLPSRWDLPASILDMATHQREIRDRTWDLVNNIHGQNPDSFSAETSGTPPPIRVLVVGDSHSKDIFNAIAQNPDLYSWLEVRRLALDDRCLFNFASPPTAPTGTSAEQKNRCTTEITALKNSAVLRDAQWVLFSARWRSESIPYIDAFAQWLKTTTSAEFGVFGRTAEFKDIPRLAVRFGAVEGFEAHAAKHRLRKLDQINDKLSGIAQASAIPFLDKLPLVCSADDSRCDMLDDNNNLLFYDYGHWTLHGAKHFGAKMARQLLTRQTFESFSAAP